MQISQGQREIVNVSAKMTMNPNRRDQANSSAVSDALRVTRQYVSEARMQYVIERAGQEDLRRRSRPGMVAR